MANYTRYQQMEIIGNYHELAAQGDAGAQYKLGQEYYSGRWLPQDKEEAFR